MNWKKLKYIVLKIISSKNAIKKKNKNSKKRLVYFNEEYEKIKQETPIDFKRAKEALDKNICCNCGCILEKEIKGTKTCPECKRKIYVKKDIIINQKLEFGENEIEKFNKYYDKLLEITFMERIMKNTEYIFNDYIDIFYSLKKNSNNSIRDIMWQYFNKVGCELDNLGYKRFMKAKKLNIHNRALKAWGVENTFRTATLAYVYLYQIAEYKDKTEVAFNLLTHIAYRDIHQEILYEELNEFCSYNLREYISRVHSGLIIKFIEKNNYTITDFKNRFLEIKHPFILPRLSNEDTWKYIEIALRGGYKI